MYETKQEHKSISEHYTQMRALWEELGSINTLPHISTVSTEIIDFVEELNKQKKELKLL